MSRRKGEFEHRTSIFEGAYRAWSHLGGCDPDKLLSVNAADELDPLLYPHTDDIRLIDSTDNTIAIDGRMQYAYEPLPRTGLQHPFVQGIIAPWLGPKADEEDVKQGLTTLRTWWQHRRKRESASAIKALGTDKMLGVVEGYTRHFFKMAVCMVVHDHEQPPRSLLGRLQLRHNLDENTATKSYTSMASTVTEKLTRQLSGSNHDFLPEPETSGGVSCCGGGPPTAPNAAPGAPIEVAGQPAKKIQRREMEDMDMEMDTEPIMSNTQPSLYGDPSRTPVVFVSANGDIQVAMSIQGITCTQCVKMIETVLKGVDGSLSNIDGLLDAVADKDLAAVIIKIARASDAKRIVFQSAEVLSMLGYTATPREMDVTNNKGVKLDLSSLSAAYDIVAATDAKDVFDWSLRCNCPDNGVIRDDCVRHSQMNKRIFDAFDKREKELIDYVAGCGKKHGRPCTCAPGTCKCKSGCCKKPQQYQSSNETRNIFGLDPSPTSFPHLVPNGQHQINHPNQQQQQQQQVRGHYAFGNFNQQQHQQQHQQQQHQQQQQQSQQQQSQQQQSQQPQQQQSQQPPAHFLGSLGNTNTNGMMPHASAFPQSAPLIHPQIYPSNDQAVFPFVPPQQHNISLDTHSNPLVDIQVQQQQQQHNFNMQQLLQMQQAQRLALLGGGNSNLNPATNEQVTNIFTDTRQKHGGWDL